VVYTSEIEKLERRWAENPKGRNFAPLADAYRKAGELDRALELCKAGLELHPDYVSAHIVYGRCLIDQKNDPGASDVFRKVLALDPENVLALKILAEIAERGGRFDETVDWLGRLLAADPMNGDAAEALTRAKAKAGAATALKSPEPVVRLVPEAAGPAAAAARRRPTPPPPLTPPPPPLPPPLAAAPPPAAARPAAHQDFVVEHASEEPPSTRLDTKGAPADIETFDGTIDFNAVAREQARADGIEVQEEIELKPQDLVVEGLAHTQFEAVFGAAADATAPEEDLPTIDLPLIMPDDVGAMEPAAPPSPAAPPPAPAAQRAPAVAGAAGSLGPSTEPPAAVSLSDDDGAADTAALSRAEPVLTETMAELYLRQGHPEEALRVYQALLSQRPGDARLRKRVESLVYGGTRDQGRGTGETVQVFLKRILAGRPGVPAAYETAEPAPATAPATAHGSPLERAFGVGGAVSSPRESDPGIVAPGEATRPAVDGISLDQVFGDEGPRGSLPPSAPLTEPPHAAPAPAPQPSGGFSFDQFFSTPEPAAGGRPGTAGEGGAGVAVPPPRTSGGATRPAVEDESDLDQFQAWLRGLKS
jgi:tetratricopeptide (TPR) repeat protein